MHTHTHIQPCIHTYIHMCSEAFEKQIVRIAAKTTKLKLIINWRQATFEFLFWLVFFFFLSFLFDCWAFVWFFLLACAHSYIGLLCKCVLIAFCAFEAHIQTYIHIPISMHSATQLPSRPLPVYRFC